jgi:MFS family permease
MRVPYILTRPSNVFCILVVVNFLNYVDRGIIPGANDEFIRYISFNLDTSDPDVFLGLLQSSFIVGFSLASLVFGHLVHFYGPFTLISIGLSLWLLATILCGIGFQHNSFSLLLCARMLSGVGEASFSCSVPPWITKYGPIGRKATWLALYYTAIPVGMAFGYPYAALIGGAIGCEWVFFFESFAMIPCIVFLVSISHAYPCEFHHEPSTQRGHGHRPSHHIGDSSVADNSTLKKPLLQLEDGEVYCNADLEDRANSHLANNIDHENSGLLAPAATSADAVAPSVFEEFRAVMSCPIYLCFVAGTLVSLSVSQ